MVVSMLKNLSHKYSNHYNIKFIDLIPIYYTINLHNIYLFMIFSNLYFGFIDLL